jgi:hypothetical protein
MRKVVAVLGSIICVLILKSCSPKVGKSASSSQEQKPKASAPAPNTPSTSVPIPTQRVEEDPDQPKMIPANTLPMEKVKEK